MRYLGYLIGLFWFKMRENKYGNYFKELRKQREYTLEDFKEIVPKSTLNKFEKGETDLPILKLEKLLLKLGISLVDFISNSSKDYINPLYGSYFKEIREQRGYQLCDYQNIGVSSQELNAFEEGKYMFRFDKLEEIFENMDLVASDFHRILTDGHTDVFIDIFEKIEAAYHAHDEVILEKIYKEYSETGFVDHQMVAISAKTCYSSLSEDEILQVSDFLMGVEHWTTFELSIFSCVVNYLDYRLVSSLAKEFLKNKENLIMGYYYKKCLMQAVVKLTLKFLVNDQIARASKTIKYGRELLTTSDEYIRTIYFFAVGCWHYKTNNPEGLKLVDKIIDYVDMIDDQSLKNRLIDVKNEFLNNLK